MTEQITDCSDESQRKLEKTLGIEHRPEHKVSGGPVEGGLKEGWGLLCFQGKVAHYWTDITELWESVNSPQIAYGERIRFHESKCKIIGNSHTKRKPMFHPGSYPKCKRCLAALKREG